MVPSSLSDLQSKVGALGLPFPVLSDEQGNVARMYLGSEWAAGYVGGIFVTDRFGALRMETLAPTPTNLPNQASILDWLNLIESECPECGPADVIFSE